MILAIVVTSSGMLSDLPTPSRLYRGRDPAGTLALSRGPRRFGGPDSPSI